MNWSLFPINLKYGISTNERLVEVFSVNHTNTIFKIASLLLMGKSIWTHSVSVDLATVMSVVRPYVETLVTNSVLSCDLRCAINLGLCAFDIYLCSKNLSKLIIIYPRVIVSALCQETNMCNTNLAMGFTNLIQYVLVSDS
jgi:hypothetical protein